MSERGSFVTEYIYCLKCFESLEKILLDKQKYLCSVAIPTWVENLNLVNQGNRDVLPIIAGKIGGLWPGEELFTFDYCLRDAIENVICHEVKIAVLADCGEGSIFTFKNKLND